MRFDHGTWSSVGGFASAGATTGEAASDAVTIDVPGLPAASVLTRIFVLTYDGGDAGGPHWVDRAPGGTSPTEDAFGADFVVGSCTAGGPGTGPGPGGGQTAVAGRVVPARAGVPVAVTAGKRTRRAVTQADGTFSLLVPLRETTRIRAVAEGIASQTRTVTVVSTVRIKVRRGHVVTGRVRPALPGRVLLLRRGAVKPAATAKPRDGRFRIRLRDARPGRYQAVYIPSGKRAERSTSNAGVIR